jgi:hypothetical protein
MINFGQAESAAGYSHPEISCPEAFAWNQLPRINCPGAFAGNQLPRDIPFRKNFLDVSIDILAEESKNPINTVKAH